MIRRKPLPRRTLPIARSPLKKRPRKKSETFRIYGPPARRAWMTTLPCSACGVVGYSENAHIENGGMGRKADADKIVPLCGPRIIEGKRFPAPYQTGCHGMLHLIGRRDFETLHGINLKVKAETTHKLWLAYSRCRL